MQCPQLLRDRFSSQQLAPSIAIRYTIIVFQYFTEYRHSIACIGERMHLVRMPDYVQIVAGGEEFLKSFTELFPTTVKEAAFGNQREKMNKPMDKFV